MTFNKKAKTKLNIFWPILTALFLALILSPLPGQAQIITTPIPSTAIMPSVPLANLSIDEVNCSDSGNTATFTLKINNAPNAVVSLGLNVNYDPNTLEYESFEKGDLVQGFPMFDVSPSPSGPGTLKIGGLDFGSGFAAGSTGNVVKLKFNIKQCQHTELSLSDLKDDLANWSTHSGYLKVGVSSSSSTTGGTAKADLLLDDIPCPGVGNTVTFCVEVDNTPNPVNSLGMNLNYDSSVLEYKAYSRGDLTQGFTIMDVDDSQANVLKIGAIDVGLGIARGSSGSLINVAFQVKKCQESEVALDELKDSLAGWSNKAGHLTTANTSSGNTSSGNTSSTNPGNADIFLSNATCSGSGNEVIFTISINNAPNEVKSLGFEISYDGSVLQYDSFEKGTLVASFPICDVNPIDANTLKMGGLDFMTGIPAGASGTIAKLHFTVTQCGSSTINLNNLADDIGAWSTAPGQLTQGCNPPHLQAISNQQVNPGETLNLTLNATGQCTPLVYSATGLPSGATVDASTGQVSWSPSAAQINNYSVTFTVTDSSGMTDSQTTIISVVDNIPPVITTFGDITIMQIDSTGTPADDPDLVDFLNSVTATDNVDGQVVVVNDAPTTIFPPGTTIVTFSATDNAGNTVTATSTVTVQHIDCTEEDDGNLDIPGLTGPMNQEVEIPIMVNSAPNEVASFGLEVKFKPSVLTFVGYDKGDLTQDFDFINANLAVPGVVTVGGYEAGAQKIAQGMSGSLVILKFQVHGGEEDWCYPLQIEGQVDNIANWLTTGGCFCVHTCNGDINGDGKITPADSLLIFEYYLGIGPSYDCMDINEDGKITPADSLCLFQHYLGMPSCMD